MPRLEDVTRVLKQYPDRYDALDAFVDDIDELRAVSADFASVQPSIYSVMVGTDRLYIQVSEGTGVARFRLTPPAGSQNPLAGAAIGGVVGSALGAAAKTKEGLLGGLVLGVLVGAAFGAATTPAERALALQFDPSTFEWRLYDGPLARWAKRTIHPAA